MYQLHSAVINAFARIFLNVFSAKKFHTEQVSYLQIKLYAQDFHLCAKLPYCALQNFWRTNRLHPQNAVYNLRLLTSPYIFVHIRDVLFLGNIRLKISLQSSKFSSIFELFKKKVITLCYWITSQRKLSVLLRAWRKQAISRLFTFLIDYYHKLIFWINVRYERVILINLAGFEKYWKTDLNIFNQRFLVS